MLVEKVSIQGVGNIENLEIDFTTLGDGLIAVAGENGSGKSHLLAALCPASLYRVYPSYNDWIHNHFAEGGGEQRLWLRSGDRYQCILRGKRSKTPSCFLYVNDSEVAGPGVREYHAAIQEHFPPLEFLMASVYAAQEDPHGFFSMDHDERHKVFSSLLGLTEFDSFLDLLQIARATNRAQISTAESVLVDARENMDKLLAAEQRADQIQKQLGEITNSEEYIRNIKALEDEEKRVGKIEEHIRVVRAQREAILKEIKGIDAIAVAHGKSQSEIEEAIAVVESEREELQSYQKFLEAEIRKLDDARYVLYDLESVACRRLDAENRNRRYMEALVTVDLNNPLCSECKFTQNRHTCLAEIEDAGAGLPAVVDNYSQFLERLQEVRKWNKWLESEHKLELKDIKGKIQINTRRVIELREAAKEMAVMKKRDVPELPPAPDKAELLRLRETDKETKSQIQKLQNELLRAQGEISSLAPAREKLLRLEKDRATVLTRASIDDLLKRTVTEIRRDRITATCPQVQDLCNKFLETYQGGRFAVVLTTQRQKRAGGEKESFSPVIHDALSPYPRTKVSPGEGAIISEALRMAFAIVNARIAGLEGSTLIRDEATGYVDTDKISTYADILKAGIATGVFKQIIFVSHSPALNEQAQTVINLEHGYVREIVQQ